MATRTRFFFPFFYLFAQPVATYAPLHVTSARALGNDSGIFQRDSLHAPGGRFTPAEEFRLPLQPATGNAIEYAIDPACRNV